MTKRQVNPELQAAVSRSRLAGTLIDTLWLDDHFVLEDLSVRGSFPSDWAEGESAASDYAFELDVQFGSSSSAKPGSLPEFRAETRNLESGQADIVPHRLNPDCSSWIVYIPFDTSDFKLGGSSYEQTLGIPCGAAPEVEDAAYFADCFEVVREMVEDGVVLSAVTVLDGGLERAVRTIGPASVNLGGLCRAYPGTDLEHILHAELPGVLLQISDADFDYIDAEFLLQDIAYYPIGHPATKTEIRSDDGIQAILGSLIR